MRLAIHQSVLMNSPFIIEETRNMDAIKLPEPFASIPRRELTFGPSPLQHLPRMSADLAKTSPHAIHIWAKREDCNSGLAYGGNKTRKLEYVVADALAQGADTLVSIGGIQSNHTRQVAAAAAMLGLESRLLQEHWVPGDDKPEYMQVGNLQLSRLMSARPTIGPAKGANGQSKHEAENIFSHDDYKARLRGLIEAAEKEGRKPYLIPAGASDHPLGGLGFARWAFELAEQEKAIGVYFDVIVVCAVTGSTLAGMIAGFKLLQKTQGTGKKRRIIGIDASAKVEETRAIVLRLAQGTGEKIGLKAEDITGKDFELDGRYHAGCYGIADQRTTDAIKYGASMEGFITDPVYEGKSLAGLLDMARNGEISENSNVLYAHLGGQLALNSYPDIL